MRTKNHITGALLADHFGRNVRVGADGRPDLRDCRAASDELYSDSRIAKLAAEMHRDQPEIYAAAGGVRSRGGYGARAGGIGRNYNEGGAAISTNDMRDQPGMRTFEACDQGPRCDGDILGFSTIGAGIAPLAGPAVAGAIANSPEILVTSGNAQRYQPHFFFWEGRDRENDFEVTPSYFISAVIGGTQQLVGGGAAQNAITNSVFALTDLPLDVGWSQFGATDPTALRLVMGNYVPGTALDYNFVWWGNARPSPE